MGPLADYSFEWIKIDSYGSDLKGFQRNQRLPESEALNVAYVSLEYSFDYCASDMIGL